MTEEQNLTIDDLSPSASGLGIELNEFEGAKAEIETLEIKDIPSHYDEDGEWHDELAPRKMLKISTKPLKVIEREGQDNIELRASELFALKKKNGKWEWSTHPKAKLQRLMAKFKVNHPKELIGRNVVIKVTTSKKSDAQFLGFYID